MLLKKYARVPTTTPGMRVSLAPSRHCAVVGRDAEIKSRPDGLVTIACVIVSAHAVSLPIPRRARVLRLHGCNPQVSPRNRINVAVDWLKVRVFGRDITRL